MTEFASAVKAMTEFAPAVKAMAEFHRKREHLRSNTRKNK